MFLFARQRIGFVFQRCNYSTAIPEWPYPIYASERLHDRKSIFVAHASRLPNDALFPLFLEVLTASPKLKKATHCMYAYRQHDGGESGSGNHLARLLDVTGCENTVVVVSRWYGGVQLGGDRWRRITHVAKEALDKGGFCKSKDKASGAAQNSNTKKRKGK
ncbi:ribosomal protein S5 domain 2-type protein [Lentinula aff. detonsa]|nr:ribosomal protein S5 domain 2-type protein [Lentinula aff. detonsa]